MKNQIAMFDNGEKSIRHAIINVASVPQRSPFRYPGGKTWLIPTVRQWLKQDRKSVNLLIEPFAGGGIVSLTAAFEKLLTILQWLKWMKKLPQFGKWF